MYFLISCICFFFFSLTNGYCDNQTAILSPLYPGEELPFEVRVELASFSLPSGLQSYAHASYKDKILLIGGRTNGMHTFNNNNDNFPPQAQNTDVYVVDLKNKTVIFKSLADPTSGLTQAQIDLLSVTASQFYQSKDTLYIAGGYGVDTATGLFSTKNALTAIDVPGLINWVTYNINGQTASQYIRQTFHPLLQVTGGYMAKGKDNISLLMLGQNFIGYYLPSSDGIYTDQIRRFKIVDDGKKFKIIPKKSEKPNPNYRRRDLNVAPVIFKKKHERDFETGFVALSGVFTETEGAWTVPILINSSGKAKMADPADINTFKQGVNNYDCATIGLFNAKKGSMYLLLMGGITYEFFSQGVLSVDSELPFTNQLAAITIDRHRRFKQYLLPTQYPVILSTASNPGNPLLFGAEAEFFPVRNLPTYHNGVIKFDKLKNKSVIGYIVGGIQSTLPNTNVASDSAASPYIFKVILKKK